MRMKSLKMGLLFLIPLSVTSCGGDGGQQITTTSAPALLNTITTHVLGKLPTSNTVPTLPIAGASTSSVAPIHTAAATVCETSSPASPTDADSDGIALLKTSTFDCSNFTSANFLYSRKGSYEVVDLNDAVAGVIGGLKVTYNISKYDYQNTSNGEKGQGSYTGFWKYQQVNSSLVSTSDFTGKYGFYSATSNYDVDYTYGYTWVWTMTPTNMASPWTVGAISMDGTFSTSGRFMTEDHSGNHKIQEGTFSVRYYSKDTLYDTSCTKWYKSGSIFIDDSQGTVLEIRYSCSTAKLYFNGVESDIWTP